LNIYEFKIIFNPYKRKRIYEKKHFIESQEVHLGMAFHGGGRACMGESSWWAERVYTGPECQSTM
jgi:hypothetical protein